MPPARPPNGPAGTPASSSWRPTPPRGPTSASAPGPDQRPSNPAAAKVWVMSASRPSFFFCLATLRFCLARCPAEPGAGFTATATRNTTPHISGGSRQSSPRSSPRYPLLVPHPTCNPRVAHLLPPASSNAASHLETCMPARKALSSATPVLILARLLVCAHTRLAAAFALLGACAPRDGGGVASRFETGRR